LSHRKISGEGGCLAEGENIGAGRAGREEVAHRETNEEEEIRQVGATAGERGVLGECRSQGNKRSRWKREYTDQPEAADDGVNEDSSVQEPDSRVVEVHTLQVIPQASFVLGGRIPRVCVC
jgi:hypothetical protein